MCNRRTMRRKIINFFWQTIITAELHFIDEINDEIFMILFHSITLFKKIFKHAFMQNKLLINFEIKNTFFFCYFFEIKSLQKLFPFYKQQKSQNAFANTFLLFHSIEPANCDEFFKCALKSTHLHSALITYSRNFSFIFIFQLCNQTYSKKKVVIVTNLIKEQENH